MRIEIWNFEDDVNYIIFKYEYNKDSYLNRHGKVDKDIRVGEFSKDIFVERL